MTYPLTYPLTYDAIILGAGAAGLMCAAKAGQRGRRVLLIDHADEPGKKILISGGGRCNFTNSATVPERFLSANPHFAKSALGRYSPQDFVALVDDYGIAWHEKTLGQLFCDGSARQIVAMLLSEAPATVTLTLGQSITDVAHADGQFAVTVGGVVQRAPSLVIATGGPSIPKMGATGFAYDLARKFGLKIVEPRPALVPLTLGGEDVLFRELSGVAAPTRVRCGKTVFDEASLFTHRGLSGPAILQISSYWRHGAAIGIDFLPGLNARDTLLDAKRTRPKATVRSILADYLPARLAGELAERIGIVGLLADQSDKRLVEAASQLNDWQFSPNGTEGYAKAEVTLGGIDTNGLSQKTMAAKSVPGLFAIGEAVDVTGWLGGYNFQWAWASAAAAAEAL
ncbi:NAD(P)/FAD-dependent oxidoreductase [Sphingomonas sp.]|uniref:NAD(P)/FAD-dependent oxidoreductase n=1 Tax=Sphingomonas sp. TaxID=28214 RepID=UPI0025FB6954|nr:NAD(P)/FAD-dependent oxidoreductase [Sphingomonas sp.]